MKVILFDIDGTMVHTGGAGRRAMEQSFKETFGVVNGLDNIQLGGRTDPQILEEALSNHGLVADNDAKTDFKERYFRILLFQIKENPNKQKVYPGIKGLLEKLSGNDSVRVGLLTGNWKLGATTKLRHFGLDGFFEFGAFADDDIDRNKLLPFALKRCSPNGSPHQAVVIGDTPKDIMCAKVHGAKALAVATGSYSYVQLKEQDADWTFEDLSDINKVHDILISA